MVLVFLMLDYSSAGEAFFKPPPPPHRLIGRDVRGKLRLRLINATEPCHMLESGRAGEVRFVSCLFGLAA